MTTTAVPNSGLDAGAPVGPRTRWKLLVGLVAGVVVVGGVGWKLTRPSGVPVVAPTARRAAAPAQVHRSTPTAPAHTVPAAPAPTAAPSQDAQLKALVPQLETFVAKKRGLYYLHAVPVTLLAPATFEAKLTSMSSKPDPAALAQAKDELVALGLIPASTDLSASSGDINADVDGVYDYQSKQLFVKGTQITPYVRSVLVHELTHALDDQQFSLGRMASMTGNDEQQDSFRALAEGDAVRVQRAYIAAMSPADQASVDAEVKAAVGSSTSTGPTAPDLLLEAVAYPYTFGADMVDGLLAAGAFDAVQRNKDPVGDGESYVDQAFKTPPTGSLQVLNPDKYVKGIRPVVLDPPRPTSTSGYTVVDYGTLGQFPLFMMLQETFDVDTAALIASTWAGDGYVLMKDAAGNSCMRIEYEADSAPDQPILAGGLDIWAHQHDAVSEWAGVVYLTSCTGGTPQNP